MQYLVQLRKQLEASRQARLESLASGSAKDYSQYSKIVGEISGLTLAINETESLLDRINRANGDIDDD